MKLAEDPEAVTSQTQPRADGCTHVAGAPRTDEQAWNPAPVNKMLARGDWVVNALAARPSARWVRTRFSPTVFLGQNSDAKR
jgi:hypothetical protein